MIDSTGIPVESIISGCSPTLRGSARRQAVVPATVGGNERVGLGRPPGARFIGVHAVMGREDGVDYRPGGLDRVLARKERAGTSQSVAEEAFVGRLFVRLCVQQEELTLVADELLA